MLFVNGRQGVSALESLGVESSMNVDSFRCYKIYVKG
jgi:hypothetical protein